MPKKAIDYSNCCIYKIEHTEDESLVYVGHTTNFEQENIVIRLIVLDKKLDNIMTKFIE